MVHGAENNKCQPVGCCLPERGYWQVGQGEFKTDRQELVGSRWLVTTLAIKSLLHLTYRKEYNIDANTKLHQPTFHKTILSEGYLIIRIIREALLEGKQKKSIQE